ncbi:hypothetical protein [Tuberibacillus sp. Marseille-P3662]|uniref:hypothetical protein n=1 Tax=Tuberibacillus sp. Marseille-P3662 TaxID=1965358 RepID=UPI000A1CCC11|nr:hypothetical protein [Tuberibacillus sp. Marseille-P3662]
MDQYQKLKQALIQRKQDIEKQVDVNNEFGLYEPFAAGHASGELSQYDNHPADSGTALYERQKDMVLRNMEKEELNNINTALNKFVNGTYGLDEETGQPIPLERLEALPTARTIAKSKPHHVYGEQRPIEEDVLSEIEADYATNSEETEFNEQNAYDLVAAYNELGMTYDGSSNIDNQDGLGYVQLVEAIGATDMNGYRGTDHVEFLRNIQYDELMNEQIVDETTENEDDL